MNKFINKILKEAEDFSDNFFQSKHVNKRKEGFEKQLEIKKREALPKLVSGLNNIRILCKSEDWNDEHEDLFIKLFSTLHVDKKLHKVNTGYRIAYGYYLLDKNNTVKCFYDVDKNIFLLAPSIWRYLYCDFYVDYGATQEFMNKMLKKYFEIYHTSTYEWDDI